MSANNQVILTVLKMNYLVILLYLTALLLTNQGHAFPPAPGFTIYGLVRDEFGWVVESKDAQIILKKAVDGKVIARSRIQPNGTLTENYRVMCAIDHELSGENYKPEAVKDATPFTIEVVIEGETFLPTETAVSPMNGMASGTFYRLDLTLGSDSDGDNLPDRWEQWQLQAAGQEVSRIDLINPDDDIDGDGLSNRQEYIAGTFAFIFSDTLAVKIIEHHDDNWLTLEFLAVVGKTYTLERTIDLNSWERVSFGLQDKRSPLVAEWTSPDTFLQQVQVPPLSEASRAFFRVRVR